MSSSNIPKILIMAKSAANNFLSYTISVQFIYSAGEQVAVATPVLLPAFIACKCPR